MLGDESIAGDKGMMIGDLFFQLTPKPVPAGFESRVAFRLKELLGSYVDEVFIDKIGSLIARSEVGVQILEQAETDGYIVKHGLDISEQPPAGAELKKHRSPFVLQRRKKYGIPVPDYGFALGHEPGKRKPIHRAPGFSELVVEVGKEH